MTYVPAGQWKELMATVRTFPPEPMPERRRVA